MPQSLDVLNGGKIARVTNGVDALWDDARDPDQRFESMAPQTRKGHHDGSSVTAKWQSDLLDVLRMDAQVRAQHLSGSEALGG